MYDLKEWFMLPSVAKGCKLPDGTPYGRETHHLEGKNLSNNTNTYACHVDTGKAIIVAKTKNGFPWDVKAYDLQTIQDTYTEANNQGWTNLKNYKKSGWPILPRFWNGDPSVYTFAASAPWYEFENCVQVDKGDVGAILVDLQGPFDMDFQGNVGIQRTILVSYYWSDGKHREQLFLTEKAGWQNWTHALRVQLSPGFSDYKIDSSVTHNNILPGVCIPKSNCSQIP